MNYKLQEKTAEVIEVITFDGGIALLKLNYMKDK